MKKIYLPIFAMTMLLLTSCSNDPIDITTTPKIRTLTYVINTQSMYDELGITSELNSHYLNNGYSIGVYTFIYNTDGDLVTTQSTKESSFRTITETFQIEEGSYTIVTHETLVGNGYTPSWSGEGKLSTLTFNDNNSNDYHFIVGTVQNEPVMVKGGDKTETVTPVATRHLLTLNIGTQNMYDNFGRSSYENVFLSNKYNYYVGVTSLVYDNSGQFVDSVSTYVKTFQSIQQKFSLHEGSYTIVTVETLVDGDNNYKSDYWEIDNIEDLSSVVLMNYTESSVVYWDGVVGTSNCTVSIANSNHSQNVVPSAIGSLVDVTAVNFDKSDYSLVAFFTKNAPDGIMLSPNTIERYYYSNYEQSNFWTGRGYLGYVDKDDSNRLSERESMTIYIVESGSTSWLLGCSKASYLNDDGSIDLDDYPKNASQFTFRDGQIFYAYIRYRGDEKGCDANLGTYNEISKWIEGLDKIIDPDALFGEPYTTWGGTVASVKSYMSGYRAYNNGNLEEVSGNYVLTYAGKYKEEQTRYWFTSQTGGLTNAVVFFNAEKVGEDDLSKAFAEMGYIYIDSDDNYSYYFTKDFKSFVYVGLNSQNYWFVNYSNASSGSAPKRAMKKEFSTIAPKEQNAESPRALDKVDIVKQLRQCEKTIKYFK